MVEDSLTGRIDRVLRWGKYLNSDDGPLNHTEAMTDILRLAEELEARVESLQQENLELKNDRNADSRYTGAVRRA